MHVELRIHERPIKEVPISKSAVLNGTARLLKRAFFHGPPRAVYCAYDSNVLAFLLRGLIVNTAGALCCEVRV